MGKGKYIVVVLVVIALIGFGLYLGRKPVTAPAQAPAAGAPPLVGGPSAAPAATGNVDNITSELLANTANDLLPAAESDPTLLNENDTAIGGFGQSLDGSQF